MKRRYSLQVTISTLFICVITVLGFSLIGLGFYQSNKIMRESAAEFNKHVSKAMDQDVRQTYGPVRGALEHFNSSSVIEADNFEQRVKALPELTAMLVTAPSAAAFGIAYADGDYFSVMRTDSEVMREKYDVPEAALIMLRYLDKAEDGTELPDGSFKNGYIYNIYYDKNLNEISRTQGESSDFDPRMRPWYQSLAGKSVGEISRTDPYIFYDSQVVGLSVSMKISEDVVVAFDITLDNISRTIGKYSTTDSSRVVLVNLMGETIAYNYPDDSEDTGSVVSDNSLLKLVPFSQLGSGVLTHVADDVEYKKETFDFEYDGGKWIGSFLKVEGQGDLYVLMVTPVDELLIDAKATRDRQYLLILLIVSLFIPVVWLVARRISTPLNELAQEASAISRFDFSVTSKKSSFIKEVNKLDNAMEMMKSTINKFITLIDSLAGEQDLNQLIKKITRETMSISRSDAALIYLMDEQDDQLKAHFLCDKDGGQIPESDLMDMSLSDAKELFNEGENKKSNIMQLDAGTQNKLTPLLDIMDTDKLSCIVLALRNRKEDIVGMLCLIYRQSSSASHINNIEFIEALSGFSAVTLESRQSLQAVKALLDAFVESISNAIDAKSIYTGGHCERVPELTMMLAKAANDSEDDRFKDFSMTSEQVEELELAGKLHDCGKITTPVYVVDKATKLETFYDRIHEVRTRFEVLKRDAEIECWKKIADGGDKQVLLEGLEEACKALDDDFAFIAECNIGGEFMSDDRLERLQTIAEKTWMRTLDDALGVSWEESKRKENSKRTLPVEETLLADKPEHLIRRNELEKNPDEYDLGFDVDTPEYKYNRGELYNLSVRAGTLSAEERYTINDHMIQTIVMLDKLPFPKYLKDVPLLAGSHHETIDGKGYPKKLVMAEQPRRARMMVIADIFEALTASDRPYKKPKTLSESLRILSFMRNDKHIDADLFDLFLSGGVYLEYARKFLDDEQIDEVNIEDYMSKGDV